MSEHLEIAFETEICDHLAAHGWLYDEGVAANDGRGHDLVAGVLNGQIDERGLAQLGDADV